MSRLQKWVVGIIGGLAALLVIVAAGLGLWPTPADAPPKEAESIIGAPPSAPTTAPVESNRTITVQAGGSIQAAVGEAKPGDVIEIMPGTYHEAVKFTQHNLTLRGVPDANGQYPILDGEGKLDNGVFGTGSFFLIEKLQIQNYTENGVIVQGAYDLTFRDLAIHDAGKYSVFPILSTHILIERVKTSGAADAALYVGESTEITVRDNEAYESVTGIEIENSNDAVVENNYVHDNTGGILVFVLPHKNAKEGSNTVVRNNRIENNNLPNFATQGVVQQVPAGVGMIILIADGTEVTGNTFSGNGSTAIAIVAADVFFDDTSDFDIPLVPEQTWIHGNTFTNNAANPSEEAVSYGFPTGNDILWDASAWNNTIDEPSAKVFPYAPAPGWPDFGKKVVWRVIQVLK
jgi:parallel beta-helix repeat protein